MLLLFSMAGRLCWKTREIWIEHTMKSRSNGGVSDFWELNAKCEIVVSFLAVVLQRKTTTKDNWIELSAEKIPR